MEANINIIHFYCLIVRISEPEPVPDVPGLRPRGHRRRGRHQRQRRLRALRTPMRGRLIHCRGRRENSLHILIYSR